MDSSTQRQTVRQLEITRNFLQETINNLRRENDVNEEEIEEVVYTPAPVKSVTSTRNKQIKEQIEQFKQRMQLVIDKPIRFEFGTHIFSITISDIKQARLLDLVNKPERRQREDGSWYTPTVVTLICGEVERIHIYLEDIEIVVPSLHGVTIRMINGMELKCTYL